MFKAMRTNLFSIMCTSLAMQLVVFLAVTSHAELLGDRLARNEAFNKISDAATMPDDAWATPSTYIAQTPPMGWNSWYALGGEKGWVNTNEETIKEIADALVSTGLAAAGYRTVVIDDSWSSGIRQEGAGLKANSRKFPSGMDALGRFLRSRGLQLGLYTTGGNYTCAGEQGNGEESRGSGGHQHQDAELWIREWGVTYIKQCLCNTTAEIRREAFPAMRRAIDHAQHSHRAAREHPYSIALEAPALASHQEDAAEALGHGVVFECANWPDKPWEVGALQGCNVWRVSPDVPDSFEGWTEVVDRAEASGVNRNAGVRASKWGGGWSSFDYLRIREAGGAQGRAQTLGEYRAQMSMYAVLGAPLFIGVDVRALSKAALAIYSNPEVLAVSQDRAGVAGHRLYQDVQSQVEAWVRMLSPAPECKDGLAGMGADGTGRQARRGWVGGGGVRGGGGHEGELMLMDGWEGGQWAGPRDEVMKCQPRAGLVLLNRGEHEQRIRVSLQQIAESPGFAAWLDVFWHRSVVYVSVRDLWGHVDRAAISSGMMGVRKEGGRVEGDLVQGEVVEGVAAHEASMLVLTLCVAEPIRSALKAGPDMQGADQAVWGDR